MANETRVRANFLGGLVEDNPLASGATTLTSAGLASLPAIGATEHMALILDPDGVGGNPEIAYVTAHTAAATTATILRGQESTVARAHDRDTPWLHGPTVKDFDASGLIGLTSYRPAVDGPAFNSTSLPYVDVHATNLKVEFVGPPSGKVLVRLSAAYYHNANSWAFFSVREGSTDLVKQAISTVNSQAHLVSAALLITGVTPGAAKTYKWGWSVASGTHYMYGGPQDGAFVMEVWAVNL